MSARVSALLGALTLSLVAACGGGSSGGQAQKSASPTPPPKPCPLTGKQPTDKQDVNRPALAMKIDNIDLGRPQAGIDRADMVFEETVEGGLTRLFVVFQCDGTGSVGPVRSARTTDGALLRLFDGAIFGYSGANPKAIKPVKRISHAVLLSYDANPTLYHRDNSRPAPHNVFTSTSTLVKAGLKQDDSLDAPPAVFTYGTLTAGANAAKTISLRWSPDASAVWTWSRRGWLRSQNGTPDVLANHRRVTSPNVVAMQITTKDTGIRDVVGNASPDDVVVGTGKVSVFRDGKVITGTWKRPDLDSPITLTDAQGRPIALAAGPTWVELLPPNATMVVR